MDQTYKNLEIILVDDGSPDRCPQMCDAWARKDKRIIVVHKENGGVSSARNLGLDIAKGSLVGFIDSDDYIAPNMYERLYGLMTEHDADIATCFPRSVFENTDSISPESFEQSVLIFSGREVLQEFGKRDFGWLLWYCDALWNKLYKAKLFEALRFPEDRVFEEIIAPEFLAAVAGLWSLKSRCITMYSTMIV